MYHFTQFSVPHSCRLGNGCPSNYPYVFYNGDKCCRYNREGYQWGAGESCNGGTLQFDSTCCQYSAETKCENPPCSNYGQSGM